MRNDIKTVFTQLSLTQRVGRGIGPQFRLTHSVDYSRKLFSWCVELYAQQCRLRIQNPVVSSRQRFQGKIVGSKCLTYQALRSITMNSLSYRLL